MATEAVTPQQISFFPGNRRKVELEDWQPLLNAQDEKRVRLDILMPLTGEPVIGMPEWLSPAYQTMTRKGSVEKDIPITTEIEACTFEGFSTEGSKRNIEIDKGGLDLTKEEMGHRNVLIPGATLRNFKLVRVTRNEQGIVALKFSITFKADSGLVLWAHKYHGGTFWASFVVTQPTLDLGTQDDKQMKLGESSEVCGFKVGKMVCKSKPHDITVAHDLVEELVEQTPAEAEKNAKEFLTKTAQKAVSKQPIEEQAAELASAKKPN